MSLRRAASLLALLLLAGCGKPKPSRVMVLGLDGMDPQTVDLLMSEGKLPNFARLRQQGAYAPLQSAEPMLSPILWTTIATGKTPDLHRIGHFGGGQRGGRAASGDEPHAEGEGALEHPLREAAPRRGGGLVGHLAREERERGDGQGLHGDSKPKGKTWPPELVDRLAPLVKRPQDLTRAEVAPFVSVSQEEFDRPFDLDDEACSRA